MDTPTLDPNFVEEVNIPAMRAMALSANALVDARVKFVSMPVLSVEDFHTLQDEAHRRIDLIAAYLEGKL